MEIKRVKTQKNTMELIVSVKEITPSKEQNFQPFLSYETSIDGVRVSLRFTREVDTRPLEELYKEGIRRFKMTCACDGVSAKYTYPRCYVSEVYEVEITE